MKKSFFLILIPIFLFSSNFDFKLKPIKIAKNSYYIYGKEEYFSKKNGADIANVAFIETKNSVILIDTGSSFLYGKAVKETIEKLTKKKVKYIINTHHHPDHFLGNNAFNDATIYATLFTADEIKTNGDKYIENLVNIVGDVMTNTKIKNVDKILTKKSIKFDGYKLDILYLDGHTKSDIAIYDKKTKVLYAADLVFNHRALATPHANIKEWINSLENLKKIDFKVCVPGHGLAFNSKKPIDKDIRYLNFLDTTLKMAAKKGLDIYEILDLTFPKDISSFSMFKEEFERSVINLFPIYEKNTK